MFEVKNPALDRKLQELLNRKASRWGNVPIKSFSQDIELLQSVIKQQRAEINRLSKLAEKREGESA